MAEATITYTDGRDEDFVALCAQLDAVLAREALDKAVQERLDLFCLLDGLDDAFVARVDGRLAGCVAFKNAGEGVAEIKRMFVRSECRGAGVAQKLLAALEEKAAEKGFSALVLETGKHLESARRLYAKAGFAIIPNFGIYAEMPGSVCMRKELVSTGR